MACQEFARRHGPFAFRLDPHQAQASTPGPHDLCLIAEGAKARCGDPGTIRKSYLHEGWTISLRCN